jgi:RND family efflux transporter MFP subunit
LRWLLPVVVLAAGLAGARWMVASRPEVETSRPEVPAPIVRTLVARRGDAELRVESTGTVRPVAEVRVVTEVEGRVLEVSPRLAAGGFVAADEVLVRIDPRDYELALVRAQADVARASAALQREQAEADVAREQWGDLGRGEATPLALREPQLAEARADLEAARAAQAAAELDLERTTIRAPFDARVRNERVDVGQFVVRAEQLAQLYPTDRVEVLLPVPSAELFALERPDAAGDADGPEVLLEADWAGAPRRWHGRVVRTEGEIDARTRMVQLVAEVRDPFARHGVPSNGTGGERPAARLELGLFVRATVVGRTVSGVIALPRSALRGGDALWVVDDQQRLRLRSVEVARSEGETVYLTAGLENGERVCLSSLDAPVEGMRVRLEAEEAAEAGR